MTTIMEDGYAVTVEGILKYIKESVYSCIRLYDDVAQAILFRFHERITNGVAFQGQSPKVSGTGILFVIGKCQKDDW